jgi:raffinose/stachyose/melibiose transport system permease protein
VTTALKRYGLGALAIAVTIVVFIVPLAFMALTAVKDRREAAKLDFSWPTTFNFVENFQDVLSARKFMLVTAFINSTILTVVSVTILVILAAMVAWILQRRRSRWNGVANFLILSGLIIPPAVVPTIWVLQSMGLFKTLPGLILIEVAFGLSFCVMLFRAFIASIPKELDEAAVIDGCGPVRLFFRVIFPLLRSVIVTVIVVQSVHIFNDFQNPLYFLPGADNATVQTTLYSFAGPNLSFYNLLFMDFLLITIPPLVAYIFFNRQIIAGMTSGAVKG